MLLFVVSGVWSYLRLGRDEDPPFTVKTMIVTTAWPGAAIEETILQVTDRIEKKLQETPSLDYLKSYTLSGQSTILVVLKESTPPASVPDVWDKVRKFLPALYVAWFRVKEPAQERPVRAKTSAPAAAL